MSPNLSRWLAIAAGAVVFGTLMAYRSSLHSAWAQLLVAGAAGGVLGLMIVGAQRRPRAGP